MYVNLYSLLLPRDDLQWLDSAFIIVKINRLIVDLPNHKTPGPDGFNGEFLKHCWRIIAEDFYNLCEAFHEGEICLRSIYSSNITLIPKKDTPLTVNDYRPISLLNSPSKLLTKILAKRLQQVILLLVHANQYGFIKTRTIQDCLAWAFKYLHLCKNSRKEPVILKIDFEKAFDTIEHQAILQVLHHKGFSSIWISWIKCILDSRTSLVLLNGVLGKVFHCKRVLNRVILYLPCYLPSQLIFYNLWLIRPNNKIS